MSKSRLPSRVALAQVGGSRCISGRPPTGRTRIRSLETSVTLGATTTWTCVLLELPDELAQLVAPEPDGAAGEEDDVGLGLLDQRGDVGRCRRAPGCRRASPRGSSWRGVDRADDVVAEPRLAAQHPRDLVDVRCRAGDDHALLEAPGDPGAVQRPPSDQRPSEQQRDADDEREQEEAAGERELGEVAADADQAGGQQAGVEDPLVLVGAGAEDVGTVAAVEVDEGEPSQGEERSDARSGRRSRRRSWRTRARCWRPTTAIATETVTSTRSVTRCEDGEVAQRPAVRRGGDPRAHLGQDGHGFPAVGGSRRWGGGYRSRHYVPHDPGFRTLGAEKM